MALAYSTVRLIEIKDASVYGGPLLKRGSQRAVQAVLEVEFAAPEHHVGEQIPVKRRVLF